MDYRIVHELPGRIRLKCRRGHAFTEHEAGVIEYLLEAQDGVLEVAASHVTGSVLVLYDCGHKGGQDRERILAAASAIDRSYLEGESLPAKYREPGIALGTCALFARSALGRLLPMPVRVAINAVRFLPFLLRGLRSLASGKLDVSVLDASAIGASMVLGDVGTASTIMTLLSFGDMLEGWTKERSKRKLAEGLAFSCDTLWVERDGVQMEIPASDVKVGCEVVVRSGAVIPVDGTVTRGEASVNQSVMTGESLPVHRYPGTSVYAGTLVEEGELLVKVTAFDRGTRVSRIAMMIDDSVAMKANVQGQAEMLADAVVPYSFMLAGAVFLITGRLRKAVSALLVDYSCAIKLSTPLAILSAMREGARLGIVAKGGRILEKIAEADTTVFDKTGTLSVASPSVAKVVPFGGWTRESVLRTAACLEEHFPHSIARAVVKKAEEEDLKHSEEHAEVEYAVAHGIVSRICDSRVIIGSEHFVLEDEKIPVSDQEASVIAALPPNQSMLYLAVGGRLAGVLCVEDPLRSEAKEVITRLRGEGIRRIGMLTGDHERSASHAAQALGVDFYGSSMLPEQKIGYIEKLRASGAKVIMVGDGINDSPALGASDVGMAMKESADIAREVSDVVITRGGLESVLTARRLASGVMRRVYGNYVFIVLINSALLALGLGGIITPSASALLHNASTIGASAMSMMPILRDGGPDGRDDR
ncbi:MAG: heavy metal translocating P-type ATPase [Synergistaceae bacterium]|jgi:heavy metal translocating P-type ATPase|nr:heavy metal translocating P-type ATPase [Synergistaceae bacterium]